uniref:Solute carrier family 30 member 1b n=1 Tax=Salmo trutta TaxID=8032 RepID=A0A673YI90_SALTR
MAWERNRLRLLCMLRMTASLSMLSYSFHMLPDVIALVVALIAVHFSEKTQATSQNTFGWIRAEAMGALVNAVFLTAMCFTIIIEAVEWFTVPHETERPRVVFGVGAAGLLVNLLGLLLFHDRSRRRSRYDNLVVHMKDISLEDWNDSHHDSASQLNMQGVFLHVLGDALGSVIVVVNALTFTYAWQPLHFTGPCWVLYLNPTLCIIMVGFLLYTTLPLLKESVLILLQTVPKQIDMPRLLGRLRGLDGVLAVHDLHIWQLAGSRIIATAHIKCLDPASYMDVAMCHVLTSRGCSWVRTWQKSLCVFIVSLILAV